jgi:hypothetical protein
LQARLEVGVSTVSIREFSYNPSAKFARVERGETIEVTATVTSSLFCCLRPSPLADIHRSWPGVFSGLRRPGRAISIGCPTTKYPPTQNRWTSSSPHGLRMIVDLS